jgi:hypothetical protein
MRPLALALKRKCHLDVTLIKAAPEFEPGDKITRDGITYEVEIDLGDRVRVIVPQSTFHHRAGVGLRLPSGNTTEIAKSDLALL